MTSMSGDLEDFLRRAAQRRQAKAAQAKKPAAGPRERPQYSNSRTERVVRSVEAEEAHDQVLSATVVEQPGADTLAGRRERLEAAKAAAERAKAEAAEKLKKIGRQKPKTGAVVSATSDVSNHSLIAALKDPNGLRNAILLREIIDRPTHRW